MSQKGFDMDAHIERMRNILNKRNNQAGQNQQQPSMLARMRTLAATRNKTNLKKGL